MDAIKEFCTKEKLIPKLRWDYATREWELTIDGFVDQFYKSVKIKSEDIDQAFRDFHQWMAQHDGHIKVKQEPQYFQVPRHGNKVTPIRGQESMI